MDNLRLSDLKHEGLFKTDKHTKKGKVKMKKFVLASVILAIMATPVLAAPTFTIQKTDLLNMTELAQSPSPDGGQVVIDITIKTDVESAFQGDGANQLTGEVGFGGHLEDGLSSPAAWIKIGFSGLSLDLSGYTDYELVMANDNNNDTWQAALFVDSTWSSLVTIAAGSQALLNLDIQAIDSASSIGFIVQGAVDDKYHMSVSPVPAPGALLLSSMGMGLVGWLRKRRML